MNIQKRELGQGLNRGNDSRRLLKAWAGFEFNSEGVDQSIHASKPSEHPHLPGQHLVLLIVTVERKPLEIVV